MSEAICDHTSVGVIAKDSEGRILLVERMKFPFGWAPPFGHCNGHSYGTAAFKKFEEETGLTVVGAPKPVLPKNPRKYFKCLRGGDYHDWQIFEVNCKGVLRPNQDETKDAKWFSKKEIAILAMKTKWQIYWRKEIESFQDKDIAARVLRASEKEWKAEPGLESVWCEFFQELGIIRGDI